MNFRPCPRLDNANVSYSFQDWQSFILFLFSFFFEIFDYALWFVYVVLAGTFIYSVLCEVFLSLKSLVISSSYSIQSRLKPGVTQGMLIFLFSFFFYFISFLLSFCARFQLVPWAGDLCTIEFWVGVREFQVVFLIVIVIYDCFFVDLVAWLFVGFFWFDFGGSWAYINIWVPYSRLRCVLAHVHSLCSSHNWGKCLLCFLLCFFAFALGALEHYINLRGGCDNTSGCGLV